MKGIEEFIKGNSEDYEMVKNDYATRISYYEGQGLMGKNLIEELKGLSEPLATDNTGKNLADRIQEYTNSLKVFNSLKTPEDFYKYVKGGKVDKNIARIAKLQAKNYILSLIVEFNQSSKYIKLGYVEPNSYKVIESKFFEANGFKYNTLLFREDLIEDIKKLKGVNFYINFLDKNGFNTNLEERVDEYVMRSNYDLWDKRELKQHKKELKRNAKYAEEFNSKMEDAKFSLLEDSYLYERVYTFKENIIEEEFNKDYFEDIKKLIVFLKKVGV